LPATLLLNSIAKKVALRKFQIAQPLQNQYEFCRKLARAVWKTATFGPNSAIDAISENEISSQRQRPGSSVASAAP
jgi:hypothetical protein